MPLKKVSEASVDYPTIVVIDHKTRVIEARDGSQWVVQRRADKAGWLAWMYFHTRAGILHYYRTPELEALPERL